jgi:tetratricopeptide (TPR) repeat protein
VLTAAVFGQVARFEFVEFWDDNLFVTKNLPVQRGITWEGLQWAFLTTHGYLWHPAVWLSLMLDAEIYGLNPAGFHLTNLALHLANTFLLFSLLTAMTGALWRSVFVAALFALHPLHVESVAWVTERKDVLSALFWMLTLWAYTRYARKSTVRRYVPVAVCFVAALLSKPMAVTLPVVMLLLDYWPLGRQGLSPLWRPALWLEKVPLLALGAAVSVVAFISMASSSAFSVGAGSVVERVQTATVAYAFYLFKMVWPSGLSISYPRPGAFPAWVVAASAGSLVCITALVARGAARRPYLVTGWLWYVVTLLPVSGLFPFGSGFWLAADRYTYIPLIGPFIMIAWLAPELLGRRRSGKVFLGAAAGAVTVALVVLTWRQVGVWRSGTALFEHVMRVSPGNWPVMHSMAALLEDQGRLDEAVSLWRQALQLRPRSVPMRNGLSMALLAKGETAQALAEAATVLRLAPASSWGHFNLAGALKAQGRIAEARTHYERALDLAPHFPEAHYRLAILLARQGEFEKAVSHYREVLRLGKEFPELHFNLAVALGGLGRTEEAMVHYRGALQANPAYAIAWLNLGNLLLGQGKIDEALSCYRKVLSIEPDHARTHYIMGVVYARQGNPEEALRHYRKLQGLKSSLAEKLQKEIEANRESSSSSSCEEGESSKSEEGTLLPAFLRNPRCTD